MFTKPLKILYVEDEMILRLHARRALMSVGWDVLEASNSSDAVRILDTVDDIDLLFTDVRLPGALDGIEVAEYARSSNPSLPVVLTSGFISEIDERLSVFRDNFCFIGKPYGLDEVLSAIYQLSNTKLQKNLAHFETSLPLHLRYPSNDFLQVFEVP